MIPLRVPRRARTIRILFTAALWAAFAYAAPALAGGGGGGGGVQAVTVPGPSTVLLAAAHAIALLYGLARLRKRRR